MLSSKTNCIVLMLVAALSVFSIVQSEVTSKDVRTVELNQLPVTDYCLDCICAAISGCNETLTCFDDVCGLFHITWGYWADAGKPTVNDEGANSQSAFRNCVTVPECAVRTVQAYMTRFGQDCNNDGVINCLDHAALHVLGGYTCRDILPAHYEHEFKRCIQSASSIH